MLVSLLWRTVRKYCEIDYRLRTINKEKRPRISSFDTAENTSKHIYMHSDRKRTLKGVFDFWKSQTSRPALRLYENPLFVTSRMRQNPYVLGSWRHTRYQTVLCLKVQISQKAPRLLSHPLIWHIVEVGVAVSILPYLLLSSSKKETFYLVVQRGRFPRSGIALLCDGVFRKQHYRWRARNGSETEKYEQKDREATEGR